MRGGRKEGEKDTGENERDSMRRTSSSEGDKSYRVILMIRWNKGRKELFRRANGDPSRERANGDRSVDDIHHSETWLRRLRWTSRTWPERPPPGA